MSNLNANLEFDLNWPAVSKKSILTPAVPKLHIFRESKIRIWTWLTRIIPFSFFRACIISNSCITYLWISKPSKNENEKETPWYHATALPIQKQRKRCFHFPSSDMNCKMRPSLFCFIEENASDYRWFIQG